MGFPSDQTNFEHTFGAKVTFYKPIDAEEIVAKTVTINGKSDSTSLIVRESSNLSTLSVSNQSIFKNISVTGIATVNNLEVTGELMMVMETLELLGRFYHLMELIPSGLTHLMLMLVLHLVLAQMKMAMMLSNM